MLICDSPCHGYQYHYGLADDYPDGDPQGRVPEKLISELAEIGVDIYAICIDYSCRKMLDIFSNSYEKITKKPMQIGNLGQSVVSLGNFVSETVATSVQASTLGTEDRLLKNALRIVSQLRRQ